MIVQLNLEPGDILYQTLTFQRDLPQKCIYEVGKNNIVRIVQRGCKCYVDYGDEAITRIDLREVSHLTSKRLTQSVQYSSGSC